MVVGCVLNVAAPPVYQAIVKGFTVYAGSDVKLAMRTFEVFAEGEATASGAGMIVYAITPAGARRHMVAGYENRPVVEAHAMGTDRTFIGCLYGVSQAQWQDRERLP